VRESDRCASLFDLLRLFSLFFARPAKYEREINSPVESEERGKRILNIEIQNSIPSLSLSLSLTDVLGVARQTLKSDPDALALGVEDGTISRIFDVD